MDTLEITKFVAGACGALLIFLLVQTAAHTVLHPSAGHGDDHHMAYVIEVPEDAPAEEAVEVAEVDFETLLASADASAGERLFRACAACHKLEPGANGVGPYLHGVVGRDIGAASEYAYSEALAGMDTAWTPENLSGFLEAPSDWAPGTKMAYRGMSKAEDRANLIVYLDETDD